MSRADASAAITFYGLGPAAAMPFSAPVDVPRDAPAAPAVPATGACRRRPSRRRTVLRRLIPLLAVLAALGLAACNATFQPQDQAVAASPPPGLRTDQARLYFYRPNDSLFPAIRPSVIINGRKVGTSVVGEAFYRDARPGRYVIFLTSDDDDRLTVTLAPGETHYVRTSIAMTWLGPRLSPNSVAREQGERELQGLALVEPRLAN